MADNNYEKMVLRMPYQEYVKLTTEKNSRRRTVRLTYELDEAICMTAKEMGIDPCSCIRHLVVEGLKYKKKMR